MIRNRKRIMAIRKDRTLDVKGLNCPLPILKTKVVLNEMDVGGILYVEATDPHAVIDFEAYCASTEHKLLSMDIDMDIIRIYIQCMQASQ